MTPEVMYESDEGIVARDLTAYTLQERTKDNIPSHRAKDEVPDNFGGVFRQLWELPSKLDVHIKAGNRLYVGGPGVVEAIDTTAGQEPKVVWRAEFEGTPHANAGRRREAVHRDGRRQHSRLRRSSGRRRDQARRRPKPRRLRPTSGPRKPAAILEATGVRDGYALVLGIDRGRLVEELVRQSSLHVIAVDDDAGKVAALRERLYLAGLYGTRVERAGRKSRDLSVPAVSGQSRRFGNPR